MTTFLTILASVTAVAFAITKVAEAWLAVQKLRQGKKTGLASPAKLTGAAKITKAIVWFDIVMQLTSFTAFFTLFYWMVRPPAGSDLFAVQCGVALLVVLAVGVRRWSV
jgi:hypothetical protein